MSDQPSTVHLVVTVSDEYDQPLVYECSPGDYADDEHYFEVDVPAEVWARTEAGWKAGAAGVREICELVGFDPDEVRFKECCSMWVGEEARDMPRWWHIPDPGSDHHTLLGFDHPDRAAAALAKLPEQIHVLVPHHVDPATAPFRVINRSDLEVVELTRHRTHVSNCHRCGWPRDEHPESTETSADTDG